MMDGFWVGGDRQTIRWREGSYRWDGLMSSQESFTFLRYRRTALDRLESTAGTLKIRHGWLDG